MMCNIYAIKMKTAVILYLTVTVKLCGAGVLDSNLGLPASEEELKNLAEDVCNELYNFESEDEKKIQDCRRKFLKSCNSISNQPSPIHSLCQSASQVSFSLPTLDKQQLVILLPKRKERQGYYLNYRLLERNECDVEILTDSHKDTGGYELWSTVINDEAPTVWIKGPVVPHWKPQNQSYEVSIEEPYFDYINGSVYAHFNWKVTNSSACLEVELTNRCKKKTPGDFYEKTVKLGTNSSIVIGDLKLEDSCVFEVRGDDRIFNKTYDTPVCDKIPRCVPKPDIPQDVALWSSPSGASAWDVHVSWARPKHPPETYNVTLRAGDTHSVILNGNATEVTFKNVTGQGLYNVSIVAIAATGRAYTSRRAIFSKRVFPTAPAETSSVAVVMVGAWCVILIVGAAAVSAAVYWRRRREAKMRHLYFHGLEDKFPKELESEISLEISVEDSWELRTEKLLLHEVIGEGAFGVVRRGTLSPGKDVAVKMLKEFPTLDEIRSFRAEMELMKSVGAHPHIVSLVGCCSGRRPLIVAEYCSRGDLLSFLRCSWDVMVSKLNAKYYNNNIEESDYRNELFKNKRENSKLVINKLYDLQGICDPELTSLDLLSFCRQIAMGMEFLASNRVVHRDLAARNILVSGDRTLKIADFGLSRDVYQENLYKQKGNGKMPLKWMALESLTHRIYTTQSDVWSFGVVIWEVVTVGGAPYSEVLATRLPRLLKAGYRMPRPNNCSSQLYDLMLACWRARPRDRPTFSELHRQLDALLSSACADEYLSLELDADEMPPAPSAQRYLKMLLRGNRHWTKEESYERPLKGFQSNHYTSPPASMPKVQIA